MKTLLTFLFMVLFMLGPTLLKSVFNKSKKGKKTVVRTPAPTDFKSELEEEIRSNSDDSFLQESKAKIPKQPEYFTYETLDGDGGRLIENPEFEKEKSPQMSENEQKNALNLTFEEEELCKGIIYSEILKRKYN